MKKAWTTARIGDVIVENPKSTLKVRDSMSHGEYPFYTSGVSIRSCDDFLCDGKNLFIATGGRACVQYYEGKAAYSTDCYSLTTRATLTPKFLFYFLESIVAEIEEHMFEGTALRHLQKAKFREIVVPLPAAVEQQRIVAVLDAAFAGLDTARANAEKNHLNALALLESHLQSVFTQRGKGWVQEALEDVVDTSCTLSYGIVQPGNEVPNGVPIVRPTDLTTKVIRLNGLKRIDPSLAAGFRRTALLGGELLLCVRGSTGVVAMASAELVGANVTRGIVPVRFDDSIITPDFGFYLMRSSAVQDQIRLKTYGTALMQVNLRDVRNIALSFPPLGEQKRIAAQLDALTEEVVHLADLYEQKVAALATLKESLLHKAFSGQL